MNALGLLRYRFVQWACLVAATGVGIGWVLTHVSHLLLIGLVLAAVLAAAYVARYNFTRLIDFVFPRQSLVAPSHNANAAGARRTGTPPVSPAPTVEPDVALAEGIRGIDALHGLNEVRGVIQEFFTVRNVTAPSPTKLRAGTLFILTGPVGTGRFTVATNLAKMLYGQKMVRSPEATVVTTDEGLSVGTSALYGTFCNLAEKALDGLIIFKGADWLGSDSHAAVGRALSRVASKNPKQLFVAVTGSPQLLQAFQNKPDLRSAWMTVLAPCRMTFPSLSGNSVRAVIAEFEQNRAVQFHPLALQKFIAFIDETRNSTDFENAITVQALADEVYTSAAGRLKGRPVREILAEDVETALDNYHF